MKLLERQKKEMDLPMQDFELPTDAGKLYQGMPDFLEDMDNLAILGGMVNNLFDDMAAQDPFKAMSDSLKALVLQLIQALVIRSIFERI